MITEALAATPDFPSLKLVLQETVKTMQTIEGINPWSTVPVVLLTGEIFVRHDDLSRQFLVEKLAEQGVAVKTAGVMEWIYYTDYCFSKNLAGCQPTFRERPGLLLRSLWMRHYERAYKKIAAASGLLPFRCDDIPAVIAGARDLISPQLTGEAILTVGSSLCEVPRHYCGVIAIGPFGCMPNRLSEAILSKAMGRGWQLFAPEGQAARRQDVDAISELPFLAIESDGNPFPQVITAKMEVFLSQAARLHEAMSDKPGAGHG
jgi:predicted nucleotide-binding protein (sugar kinase/HSP70/actin superfamily)